MSAISKEEREILSHALANEAIVEALGVLKTDREAIRAAYWNRLDERSRKMVSHMAGVGADKGAGSLKALDALERGKINRAAARLIRDLEVIMKCAQGGELPRSMAMAGHAFDGIAEKTH